MCPQMCPNSSIYKSSLPSRSSHPLKPHFPPRSSTASKNLSPGRQRRLEHRRLRLPPPQVVNGGWNIADCVSRAYDLEQMNVGTVASGRIGLAVLRRLKPFDCKLHYTDRHRLPEAVEKELNLTYHEKVEDMVKICDVVTINCPLHPGTEHLFDEKMIFQNMKKGSYIVNTARGKICDKDVVARALKEGHLAGKIALKEGHLAGKLETDIDMRVDDQ